jgi:hypothetical protein
MITDPKRFARRRYVVEGDDLDKAKKIELIVKVDGKQLVHVQAREPGLVAFVSKPLEQGFEVDIVEVDKRHYFDRAVPEVSAEGVADWQFAAMGIELPTDG